MSGKFTGKNVLITGSSYGIGAASAERLVAGGANVVISGRTMTPDQRSRYQPISLVETAARLREYGTTVVPIRADMADPEERLALVPAAVDALGGPLHVLINNAAAGIYKPNLGYPLTHRQLMMAVNFDAPVDLIQHVAPSMIERGEGWIVNVSSGVARYHYGPPDLTAPRSVFRTGSRGPFGANQGVYGASKAALNRITVACAAELAGTGVRINTVEPNGAVMSDGAVARGMEGIPESAVQSMEAMAESIVYLCECPEERTGGVHSSLDLLDEVGLTVMTLSGSAPFPGGYRRVLDS